MTNLVLAAAISMSPADFAQLTNRIDILWSAHTNRIERIAELKRRREETRKGPPTKPFRVNDKRTWRSK